MKGVATRGYNWSLSLFIRTGGLEDLDDKITGVTGDGLLGWNLRNMRKPSSGRLLGSKV